MSELVTPPYNRAHAESGSLVDQAFDRASGARLVSGNSVRILRDADENFPALLQAINDAKRNIQFECYFISEDETGKEFAAAFAAKAREGVRVKVVYDWYGALGFASRAFWRRLRAAGVEVRCFNPPRFDSPFGWPTRDHRKMLSVDGQMAFVFGLCIDRRWLGDPQRGKAPWRDTGIEIRGPAVEDLDRAFAQVWAATGPPIPEDELPDHSDTRPAGDVSLRVIAGIPQAAALYKLDQLVAGVARRSLWLTDSYFVATPTYVHALRTAAEDGVDVRLLVPSTSDVPFTRALTLSSYHPLLECGIRVFEWKGPVLHAKTAVSDGKWARVGSTNLNPVSWVTNWELDVAVENEDFARAMERMYEEDLANASEVLLGAGGTLQRTNRAEQPRGTRRKRMRARPVVSFARRLGRVIRLGITSQLGLDPSEALMMTIAGLLLVILVEMVALWPWLVAAPVAVIGGWIALALLVKSCKLLITSKKTKNPRPSTETKPTVAIKEDGSAQRV